VSGRFWFAAGLGADEEIRRAAGVLADEVGRGLVEPVDWPHITVHPGFDAGAGRAHAEIGRLGDALVGRAVSLGPPEWYPSAEQPGVAKLDADAGLGEVRASMARLGCIEQKREPVPAHVTLVEPVGRGAGPGRRSAETLEAACEAAADAADLPGETIITGYRLVSRHP
jgi:hypothetical protein